LYNKDKIMTLQYKTIQKIISSLIIIATLMPAVLLLCFSKKADAQWVVSDPVVEVNTGLIAADTFDIAINTTDIAVNTTDIAINTTDIALSTDITAGATVTSAEAAVERQAKSWWNEAMMILAKIFLAKITQATVKWINSGFHGSPLFLQNPQSFFTDIAKLEIKGLITLTGYDPNRFPFGKDFALNTIAAYKRQGAENMQYTLSKVINDANMLNNYRNNFNTGGWNGFLINTQYPQNNYLGYQMLATNELAQKLQGTVQNKAQEVQTTLQQGLGFLSPKMCQTNSEYNSDLINEFRPPSWDDAGYEAAHPYTGTTAADSLAWSNAKTAAKATWDKKNTCPPRANGTSGLVATTPGSVVGNHIMTAMSSSWRQGELTSVLGNSLDSILDALVNTFLTKGLTALGGLANQVPSPDNWTYYGQALGTNITVPTGTGLTADPSSVSVSPNNNATVVISGGSGDYSIQTPPDTTKATIQSSGSVLVITGVASGTTSVTVKDTSSPVKTITIPITIGTNALATSPSTVSVNTTEQKTVTISGGQTPYSIQNPPDTAKAKAELSGATLTITGINTGTTLVMIQDSSSPIKTIGVSITISASGTP